MKKPNNGHVYKSCLWAHFTVLLLFIHLCEVLQGAFILQLSNCIDSTSFSTMNTCSVWSPATLDSIERLEAQRGRRLSPAPSWLSRPLYVPPHDNKITHLPVYDISERYQAISQLPVGSSLYKVSLELMKKPTGDGLDGDVRYLVDFSPSSMPSAVIQRRSLDQCHTEVEM